MKENLPLVSVIVTNYNHYNYFAERLECIFNQTYSKFEVILLDDCSTDKSQEILVEYAKNPKVSHCVFKPLILKPLLSKAMDKKNSKQENYQKIMCLQTFLFANAV